MSLLPADEEGGSVAPPRVREELGQPGVWGEQGACKRQRHDGFSQQHGAALMMRQMQPMYVIPPVPAPDGGCAYQYQHPYTVSLQPHQQPYAAWASLAHTHAHALGQGSWYQYPPATSSLAAWHPR